MIDFYRFSKLSDQAELIHAVTKKREDAPYSFSFALHTGEAPEKIDSNRRQLAEMLQADERSYRFVLAQQTHSDHIAVITEEESRGWVSQEDAVADCDALVTDQKGVILGILTADCVPLLLYDPVVGVVAAVHAGWRGSAAKIAQKSVLRMQQHFGCEPSDIIAGIAPAIGACCYEVGSEVASHFADYAGALTPREDKYMLDLPEINKAQLMEAGVRDDNIELSRLCTACENASFFSYRQEKGCSGRFLSLIGLSTIE